MKPDCRQCIHRRDVPGSAHSQCVHPATATVHASPAAHMITLVGKRTGLDSVPGIDAAAHQLQITAAVVGIAHGWFLWPLNFDPVWLQTCVGFEASPTMTEATTCD